MSVTTAGDWIFTADADETVLVADADYLVFGAWLDTADNPAGSRTAAAFASGGDPFTRAASMVLFSATGEEVMYEGGAAGYYAKREAGSTEAASGQFTATAKLAADFGANNAVGTVTGTIDDFVRDDGEAAAWLVTLGLGSCRW